MSHVEPKIVIPHQDAVALSVETDGMVLIHQQDDGPECDHQEVRVHIDSFPRLIAGLQALLVN